MYTAFPWPSTGLIAAKPLWQHGTQPKLGQCRHDNGKPLWQDGTEPVLAHCGLIVANHYGKDGIHVQRLNWANGGLIKIDHCGKDCTGPVPA